MALTCRTDGRVLTAQVAGEVDHHAAREMRLELERQVEAARPREVVVDLGGVDFMDSSGIALLFQTKRLCEDLGAALVVKNAPRQARRVLGAAGLPNMMRFE